MKKIKLDVAALEVVSFESVPEQGGRGTVEGHASQYQTCPLINTCSCQAPSCAGTCDAPLTGQPCVYC